MAFKQAFIESMMPFAMEASKQTGVDPRIIIAQGALESAWGRAAPGNNFFGIKSHGKPGGQSLATTEVINGQPVSTNDSFRTYGGLGDSVKGYADFINANPRYKGLKEAQGLEAQIAALQASGYATDPKYGSKISSIAGGIQLPGGDTQVAGGVPLPPQRPGAPLPPPRPPMEVALGGEGVDDLSGGAGNDTLKTTTPPPEMSTLDKFLTGGPGALFGRPQEGWDAGDALTGAGVALMARDNPSGAAALASALRYKKDGKAKSNKSVVRVDQKTGQVMTYDQDTDTFKTQQVFDRAPEEPKDPTRKLWQENSDAADILYNTAEKFQKHRERIANGDVDMSILSRADKSFRELMDVPLTPKQRNAVELALDLEDMRNSKLLQAKGVQTEGDAQRALDSIVPRMGQYNADGILTALDRGYTDTVKGFSRAAQNNDSLYRKYGERIAYDGYGDQITNRKTSLDNYEKDFGTKRDAFYKNRQSTQQQTEETVTGRRQTTNGNSLEGKTAVNPSTGERMIMRNGKWEKL